MAVEHGRQLILTGQVVASNEWARQLVGRSGVHTADGVDDVMHIVEQAAAMWGDLGRLMMPEHDRPNGSLPFSITSSTCPT